MSIANPLWGSPRIIGELKKLGIDLSKSTVEKYMVKHKNPPSQTWRTFLKNHIQDLVSIDFFIVPTVKFKVLFVFVVIHHYRRKLVYFNVFLVSTFGTHCGFLLEESLAGSGSLLGYGW